MHPYSVVLFDEIEKAHPDIFNILLQILEDGSLTDSQGRRIDLSNCVIIITSNASSSNISSKILGFSGAPTNTADHSKAIDALKSTFKPEFLNRVDDIIIFDSLDNASLKKIAAIMLDDVSARAGKLDISLSFAPEVISYIASSSNEKELGARPLRRFITREIEDELATEIIEERICAGDRILSTLDEASRKIVFIKQRSPAPLPLT